MTRRWTAAVLSLLALLALACEAGAGAQPPGQSASPRPRASGLPSSMVALGDSITVGFAACVAPAPCPRNSWAIGEGGTVNSHYARILERNPAIRGQARTVAAPRATSADLPAQARSAASVRADYVTVLIGANDACRGGIGDMTEPRVFRSNVDSALRILRERMPQARILVVSIPDVYRLWQVGHTSAAVTRIWTTFGICPPLLANPTSTAPADVSRRGAFRSRIDAYNSQLEGACAAAGPRCRTDGGAVHAERFSLSLLSVTDFFHPNVDGQARIARASWPGRFTW